MAINYKTDPNSARSMAQVWFNLAGVANPSKAALDWWQKQIQQDGSNTAFKNFQTGVGQDAQSKFDPAVLAKNAAALKQSAGLDPWQPNATTPQLAGTNTKIALGPSGGLTHGGSTGNANIDGLLKAAVEIGAGAVTGGAAAPIAGALVGGINSAVNGGSVAQDLGDAASGYGAGAVGGKIGGTNGLLGSGAAPSPASGSGLPSIGAVAGAAGKAIGGTSAPSAGTDANGLPSIGSLLNSLGTTIPAVLQGANATNLQNKANDYADSAINTQKGLWDSQAPLRAAGISGMLNPSTPAPGLPEIASLRQSAAAGNPFAPKPSSFAQPNGAPPVAPTSAPALPTAGPIGAPALGGAPAMPTPPIIKPPVPPLGSLPSAGPVAGGGGAQAPSNLVY